MTIKKYDWEPGAFKLKKNKYKYRNTNNLNTQ